MFPRDPNEPRVLRWIRNPAVRRTVILTLLWTTIAVPLLVFREVLLPFGLAVLIAFIIEPWVGWAHTKGVLGVRVPRVLTVIATYVVFGLLGWMFFSTVIPQIGAEIAKIGDDAADFVANFEQARAGWVEAIVQLGERHGVPIDRAAVVAALDDYTAKATATLQENAGSLFNVGKSVVTVIVQTIFGSFLVLMLTAFISMDAARIDTFAASLIPPDYLWAYRALVRGITTGLAGVVRGQVMICLTNGVLTFLGLWLFEVKFPFVLALIATTFSLIPIFGSIISTIPIVAIALTDSLAKGVLALLWIIGIHLVEANLLNPKILGDAAKIHPVVVVFSLIAGERTSGLIGALFAVPIASVLLAVFKFLHTRALEAGREADEGRRRPPELEVRPSLPEGLRIDGPRSPTEDLPP